MEADVCLMNHVSTSHENVIIREFPESVVNPAPLVANEGTEQLMEDYLSPQKLKTLTGIHDLNEVLFLEMRVNTMQNSLGNFGSMMGNLRQLKLSNSVISSVRDLGTGLTTLHTLWMSKCGIADLDGISSLCSVKELYLAYNDITDVSPLTMLDSLQVLDLEGNLVDDIAQVEFLVLCPELRRLTLEGNPVCMKPQPHCSPLTQLDYNYRKEIQQMLPKLEYLDDEAFLFDLVDGTRVLKLTPSQLQNASLREELKSDWELVTERIKAFDETSADEASNKQTPSSHGNRPVSADRQRPSSSRTKPASARLGTARQRPGSARGESGGLGGTIRPTTAAGERDAFEEEDDSSELTHGSAAVICGNPSRALKNRRKQVTEGDGVPVSGAAFSQENGDNNQRDLFEELKAWRREFARVLDNCPETALMEEDDTNHNQSNHVSTTSSSNISPTPPQHPVSNHTRRRVTPLIRKLFPVPAPPVTSERPRTAPSFRHRQKGFESRQRRKEAQSADISGAEAVDYGNLTETRANSAPVDITISQRSLPTMSVVASDPPVISASTELRKEEVEPRPRLRPLTARPAAAPRRNKFL